MLKLHGDPRLSSSTQGAHQNTLRSVTLFSGVLHSKTLFWNSFRMLFPEHWPGMLFQKTLRCSKMPLLMQRCSVIPWTNWERLRVEDDNLGTRRRRHIRVKCHADWLLAISLQYLSPYIHYTPTTTLLRWLVYRQTPLISVGSVETFCTFGNTAPLSIKMFQVWRRLFHIHSSYG